MLFPRIVHGWCTVRFLREQVEVGDHADVLVFPAKSPDFGGFKFYGRGTLLAFSAFIIWCSLDRITKDRAWPRLPGSPFYWSRDPILIVFVIFDGLDRKKYGRGRPAPCLKNGHLFCLEIVSPT